MEPWVLPIGGPWCDGGHGAALRGCPEFASSLPQPPPGFWAGLSLCLHLKPLKHPMGSDSSWGDRAGAAVKQQSILPSRLGWLTQGAWLVQVC